MHVDYNKVDVCYVLEIFKTTPLKIFKQGARAQCASAGSTFDDRSSDPY